MPSEFQKELCIIGRKDISLDEKVFLLSAKSLPDQKILENENGIFESLKE
jgi:hypothetical protein